MSNLQSIGLEKNSQAIKLAALTYARGTVLIEELTTIPIATPQNAKRIIKHQPLLTTGLEGHEVLLRNLYLPLTKEKDIQEALHFQAEPVLPYPIDEALLVKQTLNQTDEGTVLMLVSVKKETLQKHIDEWQQLQIEPESIACLQIALCHFTKTYVAADKNVILVHIQENFLTAVLISSGKLIASFSHQIGLNSLSTALMKDISTLSENARQMGLEEIDFANFDAHQFPNFAAALVALKRQTTRFYYALNKELKGESCEHLLLTGEGAKWLNFADFLLKEVPESNKILPEKLTENKFSFTDLLAYALPIGLALNSLPTEKEAVDFRQSEFAYPKPWKRIIKPLISYFVGMTILSILFYFLGQDLLKVEENKIKQNYVDLLASMGKTYKEFETLYHTKNPDDHVVEEVINLSGNDLYERLDFMQRDIQSTPDTFPLFANIPRVSDVLAWLSTHPAIIGDKDSEEGSGKLFLENFSYTLTKRPEQTKKQEKYQVKIELEFSTAVPKLAREFHDELIKPNSFVDSKAEIKWNANRNNYKTSFYLKDKTSYL